MHPHDEAFEARSHDRVTFVPITPDLALVDRDPDLDRLVLELAVEQAIDALQCPSTPRRR